MNISQKIIDYAIWYYLKYFPSVNKLKQKLIEKFGIESLNGKKYGGICEEEIDYIVNEKLKHIIREEEVIRSKIRLYKSRGKSKLYIKQKLFERGEPKELIEKNLKEVFKDGGEEENLIREYDKLKGKYERQKIFERLTRKGFKYDDIKNILG